MNASPIKRPWPATTVELRKTDSLVPYAKNARTHSKAQVLQISQSIDRFGFTIPILISEKGEIIAGHGRVMAAKLLGLEEVPVMVAKGWSAADRRAYLIVDNQLPLNAEWDIGLLSQELTELKGDFNLESLGFSASQLADLIPASPSPVPAEPKKAPQSVVQFNIVFDDAAQQELWFGFMKKLKAEYPKTETLGARLADYIKSLGDGPL